MALIAHPERGRRDRLVAVIAITSSWGTGGLHLRPCLLYNPPTRSADVLAVEDG